MNFFRGYWKSILVCICIICLSFLNISGANVHTFSGADKAVHLLMYLVLGATLTWECLAKKSKTLQLYLTALIFPMLFGVAIELVQHFWLPQRTGDGWDILANFLGIIIGFRLVVVISSKL